MFDQAQKLRELTSQTVKRDKFSTPVISVSSGKGGTGKSFISFYLSQFLAEQGYKTLLIECDFNLSALSIHLNLNPEATIYDLFLGQSLFNEIPVEVGDNLKIIFGDNGKLNFPENRIGHIRNLFNILYERIDDYDFVILDNGAGIGPEVMEVLKNSTMNLLVSLPDTVSIMDAYVVVKMMIKNSIDIPQGVIVNRCRNFNEGSAAFENLNSATSHFFKKEMNLIGVVEESSDFRNFQLFGNTSQNYLQKHPFLNGIKASAEKLTAFNQLANNHHAV